MTPPCRVLVVEDNEDIRLAMIEALELLGHSAYGASDGLEALGALEGDTLPGLIFLDLMMPVMDGFEFRARQRAHEGWADIPVVVISAQAGMDARGAELQAAAYQRKPCNFSTLRQLVEAHCAGPR